MSQPEIGGGSTQDTVDRLARYSYGKLLAFLAARTHDVATAEDALAEAFASALADWPVNGCPQNPEAWLLAVARRKTIDIVRKQIRLENAAERFRAVSEGLDEAAAGLEIPDQRPVLMFACSHPAIEAGIRAPLILQAVLGLSAKTIASSFLTTPEAMGKRLVRAKEKIRQAGIPFRIPELEELPERLSYVLDAIYAAFTEGWSDPGGTDAVRRELANESLNLARLVVELLPQEPEALGLLALMLHAEARRLARRLSGKYIPFAEQDPALWNAQTIREAEELLRHASTMRSIGRYQLEAAIQSAHVYRHCTGQANWEEVVKLYDALFLLTNSPVVAVNRALAVAEVRGPDFALETMPEVGAEDSLSRYQPYWAARADLLARAGRNREAFDAYEVAIDLEKDPAICRFLKQRQSNLPDRPQGVLNR